MLSFLFGTCASHSHALPKTAPEGQAKTDYVQISRQDFNQLQSQIAQLQNALNDFAKKSGQSSQKRGFLVNAVVGAFYFSALLFLLALLVSMAYVFYDYNFTFKGSEKNKELGFFNYLLSKFKYEYKVIENDEEVAKTGDMDTWMRDMQVWLKDIKDLNIQQMYKGLVPLLTALKDGKIVDYMLDNFKFSYGKKENQKEEADGNSTDEEDKKDENVKTITLRELLKKPQHLFEGEIKKLIEAFGKGDLLNYLLDNWKIGDKTLRVMLGPILKLLGENSLEAILDFKITVNNNNGKEEKKTIKEIFVAPILEYITAYLGKDEKGDRLKSLKNWEGKLGKMNYEKIKNFSKYVQDIINADLNKKKAEDFSKYIEDLKKIQNFYEESIGKKEEEIFKESENLLFDCTEMIKVILNDKNLARKFGEAGGILSAGNLIDAFKNLGGLETKAQLRPQNQFSLYKIVVELREKFQIRLEKLKVKDREEAKGEKQLEGSIFMDDALNSY